MTDKKLSIEDWIKVSRDVIDEIGKDAKIYRITALIAVLVGLLLMIVTGVYWASGFIPIGIGLIFLAMSRKPIYVNLMRFRIKDKRVLEFADDVGATAGKLESNYSYQYVLITDQVSSIKIVSPGIIKGQGDTFPHVVVNKDLFSKVERGDDIYVLLGSDRHLHALSYRDEIDFIWKLVPVDGKPSTVKASIDQYLTNFGKHVRLK